MSFTKAVFHSTLFLLLVLPLVSVVPASGQSAEGGSAPPAGPSAALDPLRIALLRWYSADTTTSFAVGTQPRGVCFDGANIWVANYGSNTVTKLRANDGQVLGTFAVGTQPANVGFRRGQHLGYKLWERQRHQIACERRQGAGDIFGRTFAVRIGV
jgi:hypothetical protein